MRHDIHLSHCGSLDIAERFHASYNCEDSVSQRHHCGSPWAFFRKTQQTRCPHAEGGVRGDSAISISSTAKNVRPDLHRLQGLSETQYSCTPQCGDDLNNFFYLAAFISPTGQDDVSKFNMYTVIRVRNKGGNQRSFCAQR